MNEGAHSVGRGHRDVHAPPAMLLAPGLGQLMRPPAPIVDGLREHARLRSQRARHSIEKALRDLRGQGAPININGVARAAGDTRRTIYNHPDLVQRFRVHAQGPRTINTSHTPPTSETDAALISALRAELAVQAARYQTEIDQLKAQLRERDRALMDAREQIQCLTIESGHLSAGGDETPL